MIDTHAHLTSPLLERPLEPLLLRAQEAGIRTIINICTDLKSLEEGLKLSLLHPWIYNAAATTPHDVEREGEFFFPFVEKHADRLVAIGETGLDYHYEHSRRELQQAFLIRYFELAKRVDLPIVIHCRDAFSDLFKLADKHYAGRALLVHCFTGTQEEVEESLARGWMISFSGIVTFKKSEFLKEVAKKVPIDRLVIETDTPYLAPNSKRGKQNEPAFIQETAECIAQLKGVNLDVFVAQTTHNSRAFFQRMNL